jgi:nucleotide-binding universal stress UspA family protein
MPLRGRLCAVHADGEGERAGIRHSEEHDMATTQKPEDRRIVVGVDGSPSSREALRWAVRQAALTGSVVDAVIAWHDPASYAGYAWLVADTSYAEVAAKTLSETVDSTIAAGSDVTVRQRVVEGGAARVLLHAAHGADLLVVGSRGHGGFAGMLLGSVSEHCVQHSPCPVVIFRGHRNS